MRGTDHRSRITRLLIRRALTELLRQKPLQSITVKELCEVAGINRGTFYAHYIDLYALREEMEGEMLQDFQQALSPLLEEEQPDERTPLKITAGIFQCLKDNAEVCTMTLGPYGDKAFAAKLINIGREKCVDSQPQAAGILLRLCQRGLHRPAGKVVERGNDQQRRGGGGNRPGHHDERRGLPEPGKGSGTLRR